MARAEFSEMLTVARLVASNLSSLTRHDTNDSANFYLFIVSAHIFSYN